MSIMKRGLIGVFSIMFFLGGVAMVTPFGSEAEAGGYQKLKKYKWVTTRDLAKDHAKTHEWLEKIEGMLAEGPVCRAADDAFTDASGRFVTYPSATPVEVCDTTTGKYWEKDPDSLLRGEKVHADALAFCPTLGPGWRLPEIQEVSDLVDYSQLNPALPPTHPFMNVQSFLYSSATTDTNSSARAWRVHFFGGEVETADKTTDNYVWCVRSGL